MNHRFRMRPSLRAGLYLAAIACGLSYWGTLADDPDLGTHLVSGAWIVDHHAIPLRDFINSFNIYWHDYYWLAQIPMYKLYQLGGYDLLRVALGCVMAYLCTVLVDIVLLASPRRLTVLYPLVCVFGAVAIVAEGASIRPQIGAMAVVAVALRRLIQRPTPWEIPYLLLLTVLLVNSHIYWALIPGLWVL
jgi:hypothetical protein